MAVTEDLNACRPRSIALVLRHVGLLACCFLLAALLCFPASSNRPFHFALLGDRTGEAVPGVYKEAWREAAHNHPAFVLTVGDTIQGFNDQSMDAEWRSVLTLIKPFRRAPLFLTPGNHDVWDPPSAAAYQKYSRHPLHYAFDWHQAHFTVLNDSESDNFNTGEMQFLEADLKAHRTQPVKFIISHRPAWLISVALHNPDFPLHQLALKYGVKYVIAGHLHQMLHFKLDGVTYLSMPSSGGHLRNDKQYQHGWFFAYTDVAVQANSAVIAIHELQPPFGQGRLTKPESWGASGLLSDLGF